MEVKEVYIRGAPLEKNVIGREFDSLRARQIAFSFDSATYTHTISLFFEKPDKKAFTFKLSAIVRS